MNAQLIRGQELVEEGLRLIREATNPVKKHATKPVIKGLPYVALVNGIFYAQPGRGIGLKPCKNEVEAFETSLKIRTAKGWVSGSTSDEAQGVRALYTNGTKAKMQQMLSLRSAGYDNSAIADLLKIREATVEVFFKHPQHFIEKAKR